MKTVWRKLGSGLAVALWVVSCGACTTTTEWLNEDPAADVEKPSGPSAQEIIASLGSEDGGPPPKPERKPTPERKPKSERKPTSEPVVEVRAEEEVPEKEGKTLGETWKGWFGGGEKKEPEGSGTVAEAAEPEVAQKPEPPKKEEPVGVDEPAEPEATAEAAKPKPVKPGADVSTLDLSGDFPTATALKDREGYVLSPYDGRLINVKGIASGSLVADPRYRLEERKFFTVP